MKLSEAQIKDITTSFFRHWWNTDGSNTDQGFDDWWNGIKGHYEFLDVPDVIRQPKKIDMSVCIESGIENSLEGEYNLVFTKIKEGQYYARAIRISGN